MKIRLTLTTRNNDHLDESISKEDIEKAVAQTWQSILSFIGDKDEEAIVEKCELIER